MSDKSSVDSRPFGLAEALLLSLLTVGAYVVANGYETGYCEYFLLPADFIQFSPRVLISSFLSVTIFLFSFFWLCHMAFHLIVGRPRDPDSLSHFLLKFHAVLVCTGILLFLAFGFSWIGLRLYVYTLLIIDVAFAVMISIIYFLIKKTGILNNSETLFGENVDGFMLLKRYIDKRYLLILVFLFVAHILSTSAGLNAARNQRTFYEIKSTGLFIVKGYGDTYLCKRLTSDREGLGAETVVLQIAQFTNLALIPHVFKVPPTIK